MRAFRLAYDGTAFRGFQRQPDVATVEDTLFDALAALGVSTDAGPGQNRPPGYTAAGRTDAGASACAQTIALEAPEWLTPAALNGELPGEVRAWASAEVEESFHATTDAIERTYRYHLYAPRGDELGARAALDALAGEHDFHNLTPDDEGTVRRLGTAVERAGDFLVIDVTADGFPRQLVRRLVTLVESVATGRASLDRVERVLGEASLDGPAGVGPAPAAGLLLWDVRYDVNFTVDPEAVASARTVFDETHRAQSTRARVAETIRDSVGTLTDPSR